MNWFDLYMNRGNSIFGFLDLFIVASDTSAMIFLKLIIWT